MNTAWQAQAELGLVVYDSAPVQAPAFTGSTTEYWTSVEHERQRRVEVQRANKEQQKKARRHKVFNYLYNALSVAEIVVFIVAVFLNSWQLADLDANPLVGLDSKGLQRFGGLNSYLISDRYQYWRLLTALFVNAGAIQVWATLTTVWVYGSFLSNIISSTEIVIIFFASGLCGILVSANIGAQHVTSGTLIPAFGLTGAACVEFIMHRKRYANHLVTWLVISGSLAINLLIGASPYVDNSGNVAGFVVGAVACLVCMVVRHSQYAPRGELLLKLGVVLLSAAVLALGVLCVVGINMDLPVGRCCDQLVCTDSRFWDCEASRIYETSCKFTSYANGTAIMTCPKGNKLNMQITDTTTDAFLDMWCRTYCSPYGMPPSGSIGGGGGGSDGSGTNGGGGGTGGGSGGGRVGDGGGLS